MGDNNVNKLAYETGMYYSQNEKCQPGVPFYAFTQGELDRFVEKLPHLQGEAVPVAHSEFALRALVAAGHVSQDKVDGALSIAASTNPQPEELNEVSGDSGELPPLPKGRFVTDRHSGTSFPSYTAEQMQDYAREAVEADRAARQPVRIYGCCAQPEGELHTAECPNMRHLASRQPVENVIDVEDVLHKAVDLARGGTSAIAVVGWITSELLDGRDAGAGDA